MPAFPLRHVPALVSPKAGLEASLPAAPGCFLRPRSGCHAGATSSTRFTESWIDCLLWAFSVAWLLAQLRAERFEEETNGHADPTSRVEGHRRGRRLAGVAEATPAGPAASTPTRSPG